MHGLKTGVNNMAESQQDVSYVLSRYASVAKNARSVMEDPEATPEQKASAEVTLTKALKESDMLRSMPTPPKMTKPEAARMGLWDFVSAFVPDPIENLALYIKSGGETNPVRGSMERMFAGEAQPSPMEFKEEVNRELMGVDPNAVGDYGTDMTRALANPMNLMGIQRSVASLPITATALTSNIAGGAAGASVPRAVEESGLLDGQPQLVKDLTNATLSSLVGTTVGVGAGYTSAAASTALTAAGKGAAGSAGALPEALALAKLRALTDKFKAAEGWGDPTSFDAAMAKYRELQSLGQEIGYEFPIATLAGLKEGNEAVAQYLRDRSATDPAFRMKMNKELDSALEAVTKTFDLVVGIDRSGGASDPDILSNVFGGRKDRVTEGATKLYNKRIDALDRRYNELSWRLQSANPKKAEEVGRAITETIKQRDAVVREEAHRQFEGSLADAEARGTTFTPDETALIYSTAKKVMLADVFGDAPHPLTQVLKRFEPVESEAGGLINPATGKPFKPGGELEFPEVSVRDFDSLKRNLNLAIRQQEDIIEKNPTTSDRNNLLKLNELKNALEQVKDSASNRDPEFIQAYRDADAYFYNQMGLPYDGPTLHKINTSVYFERARNILKTPQAAKEYAAAVGPEVAQPVLKDAVYSMLSDPKRGGIINQLDGSINENALAVFRNQNEELIQLAGLTNEFADIQTLVRNTLDAKAAYNKKYTEYMNSQANGFTKAALDLDLPDTVRNLAKHRETRKEYFKALNTLRPAERQLVEHAVKREYLAQAYSKGKNIFDHLNTNASLGKLLFGKQHFADLMRLAEVIKAVDITRNSVAARAGRVDMDPMVGPAGVTTSTFFGTVRNQIFSLPRKVINLVSIGAQNKGAQKMEMLGADLLANKDIVHALANPPGYLDQGKKVILAGKNGIAQSWANTISAVTSNMDVIGNAERDTVLPLPINRTAGAGQRGGVIGGMTGSAAAEQQRREVDLNRQQQQVMGMLTGGGIPQ